MNEKKAVPRIIIPYEEYKSLLEKAERIAVIERIFASEEYVSLGEIIAVLGIDAPQKRVVK